MSDRNLGRSTAADDTPPEAVREGYRQYGARGYYQRFGGTYRNPHEDRAAALLAHCVRTHALDLHRVLDLACGSGEMTLALRALPGCGRIDGADPYTGAAYRARTGKDALPYSFEDVAAGVLDGRRYSLVVCSFALHLLEVSRLPTLLYALSRCTTTLLVLTPHKRPQLRPEWGWETVAEETSERVRARLCHPTRHR